jgi:hypothetical protein
VNSVPLLPIRLTAVGYRYILLTYPMGVLRYQAKGGERIGMRRVGHIGSVLEGRSRSALLALVLAGALLLCHGLYGASHQVFAALHDEHVSHSHSPHTDTHGVGVGKHNTPVDWQDGDGEGHLGHIAYAAALLVVSLGAVLWLLGGGRAWTRSSLSLLPKRVFSPRFLYPPPRPRPVLLQVFRL